MNYRRFRLALIWRVGLLVLTATAFVYTILATSMYALAALLCFLVCLETYSLVRLVETSNRDLTRFLESIEYSDYSQTFSIGVRGRSFDELNAAFSEVMRRFRDIRRESHENYRYLQSVVQHVGIGLIVFRDDGRVELMNSAAKRLFDVASFRDLEALGDISRALKDRIAALAPGSRDLITVPRHDELMQISIYVTELRLRDRRLRLVSFQNISNELNEKEMEAWKNLIRVLTHEIRNSLTPIASLAATVESLLTSGVEQDLVVATDRALDVREALQTIQKRSQGLLTFMEAYRSLTHIRQPSFAPVKAADLVESVVGLVRAQPAAAHIRWQCSIQPESLQLVADAQLIEQVLINLMLNAVQSLQGQADGEITVRATMDEKSRVLVRVTDNGPGIDEDAIGKIFVPFFTTRKGGSGIGLSLSRQIMRLHRGELTAVSEPNRATVFTMRF